jgi:hypothetical protein
MQTPELRTVVLKTAGLISLSLILKQIASSGLMDRGLVESMEAVGEALAGG